MLVSFYRFIENIKTSPARRDKIIVISNILALIINLIIWGFLYWSLRGIIGDNPESSTIPLHYNVFFGVDKFGKWYQAFILPLLGLIILLVNFVLAQIYFSKKSLLSYFLTISCVFIQIILLVSSFLIILINL
ncbi:hypothetical protein A2533_02835 [Candidatus Falkowbacteria bacterium RIFOXYD2_FULL_35_9]|uniref:DUF1648 domain-containing protein n=1 Tax=Candidatus Falkowbacteria bacterium RIFOXYC2_FULL_36_12 TaxID=1798002 RepID=A0A1F5T037_9BACT|nr:MAG: hypothetical protein A2300_03235 [Candidatus Falkowbacteria bacterium RIFOXYB2_FULL_35_7]OGF31831.1 MAG: hypothetical protein A2478_05100 [Candidatus Falkowbacteria bacterium RIFOXYC2_FULL_36_12]OGF46294.1 MAG: hypothetical protein A2533_02835 [Candidatus Falkowbacteria bacterium RIFOXYD2_FULL_35_9]